MVKVVVGEQKADDRHAGFDGGRKAFAGGLTREVAVERRVARDAVQAHSITRVGLCA